MDEWLLAILRLGHALAAAVWVGGAFTVALVRSAGPESSDVLVWGRWREALRTGIWVFLVTGAILTMDRLSRTAVPPVYFGVLAVKVMLGLWVFSTARTIGRPVVGPTPRTWWQQSEWRVVLGGIAIYGLALGLRAIHEQTLRG